VNGRDRKALIFYLGMVGPGLIIYLSIVAYPVFYSVWLSFTDFNPNAGGVGNFMGLFHYREMLQNPKFWHALKNNMIVVGVSVFGQIPIGFMLAYILYRKLVSAERFFQSMVFLPQFLSSIVIGILWKRLFTADGPVSRLIQITSGDPTAQFDLMLRPQTVMIPIGFALIWMYTGFYMIIFLANLQKMNTSMIEAAKIDGATEPQIFTRIILPLLTGAIIVSSILAIAGSLKGFDLIFAMTNQGLQRDNASVLPIYMYETAFRNYSNPMRFAYGAAISNAIVAISIVMIGISNFIGKHMSQDEAY